MTIVPSAFNCDIIETRNLEPKDMPLFVANESAWQFKERGKPYLDWLFERDEGAPVFAIAVAHGSLIGYYGTVATAVKVGDCVAIGYRGGIYIHPEFRRHRVSVLNLVVREIHREVKRRGTFILGFPNMRLKAYFKKRIGMRSVKSLPRYLYTIERRKRSGFFWQKRGPKLTRGVKVRTTGIFDNRFDELWERFSRFYAIIVQRDSRYLTWRFLREPGSQYHILIAEKGGELRGYAALKMLTTGHGLTGSVADLVDLKQFSITEALLRSAIEYFREKGAVQVTCTVSDDYYQHVLESLGYEQDQSLTRADCLYVKSYSETFEDDYFDHPNHWFATSDDMYLT